MKVYFDNAATTRIHPEVIKVMADVMENHYGNPSSIHSFGRQTKSLLENARKSVARNLNTAPGNIFFTSGGTEANNMAIRCSVCDYDIKHAVTSPLEHHAVLHTLEDLEKKGEIRLSLVKVDDEGHIDMEHLEELLSSNPRTLVSLMNANNEIGTVTDINRVGEICRKYDAIFHSDTVQTMGHFRHNLAALPVDFITGAAHKFHGPKGVGFLYINLDRVKISPYITGGAQERNMRGGTENIIGIVGLAKALDIAYSNMDNDSASVRALKDHMVTELRKELPGVAFNGDIGPDSLYTVLNVSLPPTDLAETLLFNLDMAIIAASEGSACSSGSNVGSHVLTALGADPDRPAIRFSFSSFNTMDEIDYAVGKLKELFLVRA
jgi:cysteine desulfurase